MPINQLPKDVTPDAGKISLVADYGSRGPNGGIPVYLINASTNEINLEAQDGDVFLKLELMDKQERWIRAQPHAFSWCGNSYMDPPSLRPGHFIKIEGYQPKKGKKREIRFSLYHQKIVISSNAGEGLISAKDIDLASRDAMTVQDGSFEFVSKVALGELRLKNEMDHIKDLQQLAIFTLASPKFDSAKSRAVLLQVSKKFPKRNADVDRAIELLNQIANRERN